MRIGYNVKRRIGRCRIEAQPDVGVIPEELAVVLRVNAGRASKHNRARRERSRRAGAAVAYRERASDAAGKRETRRIG